MEDEDWGELSAEDLDYLERDALHKVSLLHSSSSSAAAAASSSVTSYTSSAAAAAAAIVTSSQQQQPPPRSHNKVDPTITDMNHSKQLPKLSVKFLLHASGHIAAKFSYDPIIVAAFRNIPKAMWNAKERLWIFPVASLPSAEKVLSEVTSSSVELQNLDPLVRRAISAASGIPDLRVGSRKEQN